MKNIQTKIKKYWKICIIFLLIIIQVFLITNFNFIFLKVVTTSNFHPSFKEIASSVDWKPFADTFYSIGLFILILFSPIIILLFSLVKKSEHLNKEQRSDIGFLSIFSFTAIILFLSTLVTFPKESFEFFSTVLSTLLIVLGFIQLIISSLRKTTFKDFGKLEEPKVISEESKNDTKKYMPRRKFH